MLLSADHGGGHNHVPNINARVLEMFHQRVLRPAGICRPRGPYPAIPHPVSTNRARTPPGGAVSVRRRRLIVSATIIVVADTTLPQYTTIARAPLTPERIVIAPG